MLFRLELFSDFFAKAQETITSSGSVQVAMQILPPALFVVPFLAAAVNGACPCDVPPNSICSGTGTEFGCPGLPRMNAGSMEQMFQDFIDAQTSLYGEVRFPVVCDTSGQTQSVYVGTRDQVVCPDYGPNCGTGNVTPGGGNQGLNCPDFPNKGCLKSIGVCLKGDDAGVACDYFNHTCSGFCKAINGVSNPGICDNQDAGYSCSSNDECSGKRCDNIAGDGICVGGNSEGNPCASDEDCPPHNGANAGHCTPTCEFGDCSPGPYGQLRLWVQGGRCGATHTYKDGDNGYGTLYGDSYIETVTSAEGRECKRAIREVCQRLT